MINTPATRKREIFLSGIVQSLLANLRELGTGNELFRGNVERIARDIGVSEHDLRSLTQSPVGQPSLLYRHLAASRLNPDHSAITPMLNAGHQQTTEFAGNRRH